MFCKNCGKVNNDGAKFCTGCGCNFDEPLSQGETATKVGTAKALSKRAIKKPVIIVCVVLVALFSLYQIGLNAAKPERVVEKYVTAHANADYGAIYDSLDISSDQFTSKELFISTNTYSADMSKNKVTSLSITPATAKDLEEVEALPGSRVDAAYKVVYTTKIDPEPFTEIVMLTKSGKAFMIFDKYKIEPSNFIAQDYQIIAPAGIKVCFDGIELDDTELKTQKNDSNSENPIEKNVYTIPNTFIGEHTITAESDFTEKYEAPVYVKSNSTETVSNLVIKADIRSKMRKMAEETLRTFFDGMVAGKSFAEVSSQINPVTTQMDKISKAYDAFVKADWSNFDSRTVTYTNISMTGITAEKEDGSNSSLTNRTKSPLSYCLEYMVSCDVEPQAHYILWGDRHSERNFDMDVEFSYENGELKIYSVR